MPREVSSVMLLVFSLGERKSNYTENCYFPVSQVFSFLTTNFADVPIHWNGRPEDLSSKACYETENMYIFCEWDIKIGYHWTSSVSFLIFKEISALSWAYHLHEAQHLTTVAGNSLLNRFFNFCMILNH
jgi:hypothetical protein